MRCTRWHGFHKWPKWTIVTTIFDELVWNGYKELRSRMEMGVAQTRECVACGFTETDRFPRGYVLRELPAKPGIEAPTNNKGAKE